MRVQITRLDMFKMQTGTQSNESNVTIGSNVLTTIAIIGIEQQYKIHH